MNEFFKSQSGKKFYERDIPALITAFNRMAEAMEDNNKLIKEQILLEKKKLLMSKGVVQVNEKG